jgi:hypothetical protein
MTAAAAATTPARCIASLHRSNVHCLWRCFAVWNATRMTILSCAAAPSRTTTRRPKFHSKFVCLLRVIFLRLDGLPLLQYQFSLGPHHSTMESFLDIGTLGLGYDFSMDWLVVARSLLELLEGGNAAQHCSGWASVENVGPAVLAGLVSWSSLCVRSMTGSYFVRRPWTWRQCLRTALYSCWVLYHADRVSGYLASWCWWLLPSSLSSSSSSGVDEAMTHSSVPTNPMTEL